MVRFLIEKEFKHIARHSFLPKMLVGFPLMILLVLPWAATMEVTHININVVDLDHSPLSKRLIQKIDASTYFKLSGLSADNREAMESVELGTTDIILEIRPDFERHLVNEGAAQVMISSNAVNGVKGGLGASYLVGILQEYAQELRNEHLPVTAITTVPIIHIVDQYRYNPYLNYQKFMVPAIMVLLLTIICGFLPTLNIVSEKEVGTIEQMNVTPVSRFAFILSKLVPYWLIGILILTLSFGIAFIVYDLVPVGSYLTLYFFAAIYIFIVSGFGLVISNHSSNMQQAMFVMFFFIIVMILISGLFTPVASMPKWAQAITVVNPLKYFMQVLRAVFLKGSGIGELIPQLISLLIFAALSNVWAVLSYRKTA